MAALLSSEVDSIDGVVKFINECRGHDIEVQPPDINESLTNFSVNGERIRFGLAAIKNVGAAAVDLIIKEREDNGPFESIFDFCSRVDLSKANKRVMENLIRCGAFDSTGQYRSRLLAVLEEALDYGQQVQKEKNSQQMSLFGGPGQGPEINMPTIPMIGRWDERQELEYEKEALGFYVSGHPLDEYLEVLDQISNATTEMIMEKESNCNVRLGGTLKTLKTIWTKKNTQMAFAELEDMHGIVELVIFPSVFNTCSDLLVADELVAVEGRTQKDDNGVKILADKVASLEKCRPENSNSDLHFRVDTGLADRTKLLGLRDIFKKYPGTRMALLHIVSPDQKGEVIVRASEDIRIKGGLAMINEVNGFLGYDAVL
jgi:DNA polymerase-3 subunit alpha